MNWQSISLSGWGQLSRAPVLACAPANPDEAKEALGAADARGIIAFGGGRSYGDAALNSGGRALLTSGLGQIHDFDPESGALVCGPGVSYHQLLREFLPRGYLFPVSPGTGFVTIGGAVANDVHGKNHDRVGSFGDHVRWIDLMLPGGDVVRVSPEERPELFAATVGGVGLTGIMLAVCFTMRRVPSNAVVLREERIADLEGFLEAFERARESASYSVGWIDALARGASLGRGILETAEPAPAGIGAPPPRRLKVPWNLPGVALNSWSIGAFNQLYYRRVPAAGRERRVHLERFLYPLDSLLEWYRIYGRRGFYQFQCVLPDAGGRAGSRALLEAISDARSASFLAVFKTLGGEGRGYLSFPMRGYTLALDFPRRPGAKELMARLERITLDHGGRVYLAKDACLSAAGFAAMYPRLDAFRAVLEEIDPEGRMSSDMARRLGIRRPADVD